MPTTLTTSAIERSTFVVTADFTDHAGAPVVPVSMAWTLTDGSGAVVNSRSAVTISPLASSVNIVLSGADLALPSAGDPVRVLTLQGTYDSSLGNGLPLKDEVRFAIVGLEAVS